MSIRKAGERRQCSQAKKNTYVWTKKFENNVSGVFPNVRGALAFAIESQDVVTSATVAIGVPEFGVESCRDRCTALRGVVSPH